MAVLLYMERIQQGINEPSPVLYCSQFLLKLFETHNQNVLVGHAKSKTKYNDLNLAG